ncbi:hypothetical protein BZA77DRAFT_298342 [Pyronema omphalodes]|nr:hypothetical protein BZA77DRAFT_298342 [Pyronema omphalodes]
MNQKIEAPTKLNCSSRVRQICQSSLDAGYGIIIAMSTEVSQAVTSRIYPYIRFRLSIPSPDAEGQSVVYDVNHESILDLFTADDKPDLLGYIGSGTWIAQYIENSRVQSVHRVFKEIQYTLMQSPGPQNFDPGTPNLETPNAGTPNPRSPNPGSPNPGSPNAGSPDAGAPDLVTRNHGTPDPPMGRIDVDIIMDPRKHRLHASPRQSPTY